MIDPCVPPAWKEFSIRRTFRGATYDIHVQNPAGMEKGLASLSLDGQPLAGNVLPMLTAGEHRVEAVMKGLEDAHTPQFAV